MKKSYQAAEIALEKAIPAAQSDPLRPHYHFGPPAHWMNDPNGTIFIDGEYHLFYQFNPYAPRWGQIHWGHSKSSDLAHWEHLPIALTPAYEQGEQHCFSGCCVNDNGTPTIFYTSIGGRLGLANVWRGAQQWKARGDPALIHWQRGQDNPFVSQALHPRKVYHWRDPYIWRNNHEWRMVLAGKYLGDKGGSVFMYSSPDLEAWKFHGAIFKHKTRGVECPNLLEFGERTALIVSPYAQVQYALGKLENDRFKAERWLTLDHGKDFYATNTFIDNDDGYKLAGWIKVRGNGAWQGCLSLPRHITVAEDGLRIAPAAGLRSLRKNRIDWRETIAGNALEVKMTFPTDAKSPVGLILEDDERAYPVTIDTVSGEMCVLDERTRLERFDPAETLHLHVFIDRSVVEVFINERESLSTWVRPTLTKNSAWRIRLRTPALDLEAWGL